MLQGERLNKIVEYINEKKVVTIAELCKEFKVSKPTISRDLRKLELEQLINRTYGGAMSLTRGTNFEPTYAIKENEKKAEKEAIGNCAIDLISQGETIMLDSGSTTLMLAKKMINLSNITVITNDLKIAMLLSKNEKIELVVLGGQRRKGVYSLIGPFTESLLQSLNVDKVFLGADAIDIEKGITNSNIDETNIKRTMIDISKRVIVLVDSSKFGKIAFTKVCNIDSIDEIVTDSNISQNNFNKIKESKIKIHLAKVKEGGERN